jgi:putative addiction module CopG family antidote
MESPGDGAGCIWHDSCYRDIIHHIIVILWASSMNVSLRPELAKFIDDKIQSGQYRSAEEAVNKAVELLKQQEEAENRLEHLLQEAEDSGPTTDMTAKDWAEIENEGLTRLRSQKSA